MPIVLNWLLPMEMGYDNIQPNTSSSLWLGYWGSIIGAIIGAFATFVVLRYTIKNNETNNKKNIELQIKILEHNDYIKWLDGIKDYLIGIKESLDYHTLLNTISLVLKGQKDEVTKIASERSSRINQLHHRLLLNLRKEINDKDFMNSLQCACCSYNDVLHCFVLLSNIHKFFNTLNETESKKTIVEYLKIEKISTDKNAGKLPYKSSFIREILKIPSDVPFRQSVEYMETDFYDKIDRYICPSIDKFERQSLIMIEKLEQRTKING